MKEKIGITESIGIFQTNLFKSKGKGGKLRFFWKKEKIGLTYLNMLCKIRGYVGLYTDLGEFFLIINNILLGRIS